METGLYTESIHGQFSALAFVNSAKPSTLLAEDFQLHNMLEGWAREERPHWNLR